MLSSCLTAELLPIHCSSKLRISSASLSVPSSCLTLVAGSIPLGYRVSISKTFSDLEAHLDFEILLHFVKPQVNITLVVGSTPQAIEPLSLMGALMDCNGRPLPTASIRLVWSLVEVRVSIATSLRPCLDPGIF